MSTRSRKQVEPKNTNGKIKRVENSWVFVVQDKIFESGGFEIITLPHPSSAKPSKYCISGNNIYEVMTYEEPCRSWFIGESVKSDGAMQIFTPINPLFLVLPRLKELCTNRAIPFEDLMSEKGFEKIANTITNLDSVGDLKGPEDLKAYKYNESKTLDWLESRVHKLAKVLKEKNIHVTPGAASATFISSNVNQDNIDDDFYVKFAHGLISEYLQDDLITLLEKRLNIKPEIIETLAKKRKSEVDGDTVDKKRSKTSIESEIKENIVFPTTVVKKTPPLSAKEKARQKASSGSKTISSFFTKR